MSFVGYWMMLLLHASAAMLKEMNPVSASDRSLRNKAAPCCYGGHATAVQKIQAPVMIEQWMLASEIADTKTFQDRYVVVIVAWLDYATSEYACYCYGCSIWECLVHLDGDSSVCWQ